MIKSLPIEENPREKVKSLGIESLTNAELIALLIRTGTPNESVLELSNRLLKEVGGLYQIQNLNLDHLLSIKGIGEAKAITLLSIVELSKRLKSVETINYIIENPKDVYDYIKDEMMFLTQEHFMILCLDNRKKVIKKKTIFIGTVNFSVVQPREVFKEALSVNAVNIVMVHNHPSGDPTPSDADINLTFKFIDVGKILGVHVLDHVVIGWDSFYSILSNELYH